MDSGDDLGKAKKKSTTCAYSIHIHKKGVRVERNPKPKKE